MITAQVGTVENVSIIELINSIEWSVDWTEFETDHFLKNWYKTLFSDKILDPEFSIIIDELLNNGLLCPLNVIVSQRGLVMGNGHHRLFAALLCGIEQLDISFTDDIDWETSEVNNYEWPEESNHYLDDLVEIAAAVLNI